jgi:hypothetical protein
MAVYLKFQGTEGMRDPFKIVTLAVCKIVHGVNIPFVCGTVVWRFNDTVDYGIPHMHIG